MSSFKYVGATTLELIGRRSEGRSEGRSQGRSEGRGKGQE